MIVHPTEREGFEMSPSLGSGSLVVSGPHCSQELGVSMSSPAG